MAVQIVISEVRFITKALQATDVTLYYTDAPLLNDNATLITHLAHLKAVSEVRDGTGLYLTNTPYRAWLDIDQTTARHYAVQLKTKLEAQQMQIQRLQLRLANTAYIANAPKAVVEDTNRQLAEAETQAALISREYERFAN